MLDLLEKLKFDPKQADSNTIREISGNSF